MQAQPAPQPAANDDDLLNEGVEEIIAEHGGDALSAPFWRRFRTLSWRNRAIALASYGFARGSWNERGAHDGCLFM
jgi:hypothetical protein